jgi:hypothetical protein
MEVRTAVFTVTDVTQASSLLYSMVGSTNLDANGVFFTYLDPLKQYIGMFSGGLHVTMMLCKSTLETEAASRACEAPMGRVIVAWAQHLRSNA